MNVCVIVNFIVSHLILVANDGIPFYSQKTAITKYRRLCETDVKPTEISFIDIIPSHYMRS